MSTLVTNLRSALRSLREQWQRAILSMIGVMVGSMAIVLLVSISKGVQQDITDQVNDLGVNLLIILPGRVEGLMFNPNMAGQSYLRPGDAELVKAVPGVKQAARLTFVGGGIKHGKEEAFPFIIAADPSWFIIRPVQLEAGKTYTEEDQGQPVCVIGSLAREALFGTKEALGQPVNINGHVYRIVGVTKDKKQEQSLMAMGSFENVVYIPYQTLQKLEPNSQTHRIMLQTAPDVEPKSLVKAVTAALGKRLGDQQYSVLTQEDLLGLVYKIMSILTWLVTGLTSIALFVGGVGIMTIMLMSVNERSKEIGIRKTVGATRKDVFWQFLFEALVLALAGGAAGLILSYFACLALNEFTPIKPLITGGVIALSFAISTGVGGVFGLIPAMKAAKKDPVESIRNEA